MDHPIGVSGQLLVMCDDDEGLPQLVAQLEEEAMQLHLVVRVEAPGGLVGQDHRWVIDQGTGHGDPLLLSAREGCRFVLHAVGQSE